MHAALPSLRFPFSISVLPPHAQGYIIDHNLRRVLHRYVTGTFVYERVIIRWECAQTYVLREESADFTKQILIRKRYIV
jgi:hypothetical protein